MRILTILMCLLTPTIIADELTWSYESKDVNDLNIELKHFELEILSNTGINSVILPVTDYCVDLRCQLDLDTLDLQPGIYTLVVYSVVDTLEGEKRSDPSESQVLVVERLPDISNPVPPTNLDLVLDSTANWSATGPDNSLELFDGFHFDNGVIFTDSELTNIHAHYNNPIESWTTVSCEMRFEDVDGGIGLTFGSNWGASNNYCRVRRFGANRALHFANRPDSSANINPVLTLDPGTWYRVEIVKVGPEISLKVLNLINSALVGEQTVVVQDCGGNLFGVWSMGPGLKTWRNYRVDGALIWR